MYDIIIKNGTVIDGTASPVIRRDVALKDGKIMRIARNIKGEAKEVIDATGLTVTPGFIDSHAHADNAVFSHPDLIEKIEQGITTSIAGQCGSTFAPLDKSVTEKNAREILNFGKNTEIFKTFGTMAKVMEKIPLGSNLVVFVGHGAIRLATVGAENRKPTCEEKEEMKSLLREAMENGAAGMSLGLGYVPGCFCETKELIELSKIVKEYGGVLSAHIRDEGFDVFRSVEEFLTVIKTVDVKGVISHHKAMYEENWGKVHHTLELIEKANEEGFEVYCDVYPYTASHTSLASTIIDKKFRDGGNAELLKRLSDPVIRSEMKKTYLEKFGQSLENLVITYCDGLPEYRGMRISEIAKLRGQEDFEAALDIIMETSAVVGACNFCISEDDLETVLRYKRSMLCTDSTVAKNLKVYHPRVRGSFPRALGRYVRERKVITLEEMIRKCTSMPAAVYNLSSKGLIREGFDADICIFNADTIIDKADFTDCTKRCEGLQYVILNGEIVVKNAVYNGKRKGAFIPGRND